MGQPHPNPTDMPDVQVLVEERDVPVVGDTVDSSLQSTADRSLALFTGMSLHSQIDSTTVSALFDSNTTVPEMKSSRGVMDVF